MFVPYAASQGNHWLTVELQGPPRAAKLMFKASKMLVRGFKLVLGQSGKPLENKQISHACYACATASQPWQILAPNGCFKTAQSTKIDL